MTGLSAIGAAIVPRGKGAVGVLTISGPSVRMTAEKMHAIAPDLLAAAEDIANASGASPLFDRAFAPRAEVRRDRRRRFNQQPAQPGWPRSTQHLVTGATGGIGRAIGLALAPQAQRDGIEIRLAAAASREARRLQEVVERVAAAGAQAVGTRCRPDRCRLLRLSGRTGAGGLRRPQLLVSNAGASVRGQLATLTVEQWDATFSLNVRATWLLAKAARPALSASRGSIVAIASMSGLHPHPGYGAYSRPRRRW